MSVSTSQPVGFQALLGRELLCKKGGQLVTVDASALEGKFVALYFSAHWCPPCRAFTPLLKKFYLNFVAKGQPFEVVFVSSDNSKAEFEDYYMNNMPWLAVPYEMPTLRNSLNRRFKVLGIPTLTILDPSGQVVNRNARAALIKDDTGMHFPWPGQDDNSVGGNWMPLVVLVVLGLFYFFFFYGKH